MAIQMQYYNCLINAGKIKTKFLNPICMTQSSNNDQKEGLQHQLAVHDNPANQFAPLASTFRRRLLTGIGSASLVAIGANFFGVTSFLLGLSPENARRLKLDVLYPIQGYSRCIEANQAFADQGFEFIYPATWAGDQTLLYRAASKAERSFDPPAPGKAGRRNVNEPIVAFGPPGSTGELNVSVIVSTVPTNFSIEAFGGPKEVGEALIKTVTGKRPDVKGTLIQSNSREDPTTNVTYYSLEFQVESPTFRRHNVAVLCANGGRLFTLNAQSQESLWPKVKTDLYTIADSFSLTS